jgi:lipopolysaccharide biosynthesis protein
MMFEKPPSPNNRILHWARARKAHLTSTLQHILLVSIEWIPAPEKFAWRNHIFKSFPGLFQGNSAYEEWQKAYAYFVDARPAQIELIDLQKIAIPQKLESKKIAIHAHVFYSDLAPELVDHLRHFPRPYDLLISIPHDQDEVLLRKLFSTLPNLENLDILITPNRGRDIGPMLYGFGKKLLSYDCFAHIHTKKSVGTNSIGNTWRNYLWDGLLGKSEEQMLKILGLLNRYGLVYPRKFPFIDVVDCQLDNHLQRANNLCEEMHIQSPAPGFVEFPAGSMFWANTQALKPLLEKSFCQEDFELELGQTDNTIMHAIERLISHIAVSQGYSIALLTNSRLSSYYP